MPGFVLTEEEYQFIVSQENDFLTRAQTASPRASSHYQRVAKMHADFLAKEEGKRSATNKKTAARAAQEALRLERQRERFAKMQAAVQQQSAPPQSEPASNPRTERSKAS